MEPTLPHSCELRIRVTPKASRNRIEANKDGLVRVYVTSPPVDGEANSAVIKLLSKALKTSKSSIQILRGATSRDKNLRIEGLTLEEVLEKLS